MSALAGIWLSTRPPDAQHPYGYERFESLSAFVIGMLLLGSVVLIAVVAVPRLFVAPQPLEQASWGAALMLGSAGANVGLFVFLRARGDRLASPILRSEAIHALADALTAFAVLGGLAASAAGLLRFDPAVAVLLAAVVAWRAWTVIRTSTAILTDTVPVDVERLRQIALAVPGVLDAHAVRSRGEPGQVSIDLHIHVDPDLTVREAHTITLAVEAALVREIGGIAEVLVHVGGAPR